MRLFALALAAALLACGVPGAAGDGPTAGSGATAGSPSGTPSATPSSTPSSTPSATPDTPSPPSSTASSPTSGTDGGSPTAPASSDAPPAPSPPSLGPDRVVVPEPTTVSGCTVSCLYVDASTGSDANDGGTPATAFRTLARAARAVVPGSTVLVAGGTYTSDGTENPLTVATSGRPDAWITFAAAPGQRPVIQIPRGPGATAGIYLPGAAYVIIDGFEVIGQNGSITRDEAAENDGTQAVLNENCIYVDGMGFGPFHPDVPHDIVIRNTTVHGCSAGGIEANVADALTLAYNDVYDTSWWTVFGTSGIGLLHLTDVPGSGTTAGYKNWIVGNHVHGNRNELPFKAGQPPAIYDGNGIIVDDANHAQDAVGIHDTQGVPYTGRTYIANNVVHDNGGRGIHVFSSSHVDVVANTTFNDLLSSSASITAGEIDAQDSSSVDLLDNVAVNLVGKDLNMADGNRYDFNLWDGTTLPVRGPHDLAGPAGLTDPAHGDFAPRADSPAVASGTTELAPSRDFFGRPRPAGAIDRGAIQVTR
jgi:hypothetical protein